MEGVLAIIFIFGGGTLFLLSMSPVGKAFAERVRGHPSALQDPEVLEELHQLREEVSELHERVDFAERLLADRGTVPGLPDGDRGQ